MPTTSPSPTPTPPELLAPAGDWEAMRAAVANGADAVYFGLSNFNARFRATNFTVEELPDVMKYLHEHNVRGYVAFNTLVFSDELPEAAKFITACAAAGVDALIVQDLGIARLIHAMAPSLSIHGSTQMTLTEPRGIEFVRALGVQRVILARELSATEIQHIAISTAIPVEVFIHGALCVAYSGQCLTSESLGGRSANRGQCAQACRLPYDLIVDGQHKPLGDKAYLLSPQDLAAHDLIDDLVRIGVASFKIEGRLKSAQYVAATTQTYRSALDAAIARTPFRIAPQQQQELAQSFSRGFTHGFLDGPDHQELVHARFPKSRGIRVGLVAGKTRDGITVTLESSATVPLKPGDGVVFDEGHPEQDEQGGRLIAVKEIASRPSRRLELLFLPGAVNLAAITIGSIIWKTDDPAIRKRLEQSYSRETVARRAPLSVEITAIIGQPLTVTMRDPAGRTATVRSAAPMARAERHPLTVELAREQFGRLGQTPYELADLRLHGPTETAAPEPIMTPKSILNDLRRQAVDAIMAQRSTAATHAINHPNALETLRQEFSNQNSPIKNQKSEAISVLVRTTDQLQAVLNWQPPTGERPSIVYCDFEDIRRYAEAVPLANSAGLPIALATLRIVKASEEGLLQKIADYNPDAILVRNLAAVSFYSQRAPHFPLHGDYSLNIANELTAAIFHRAGLRRMVPSYDLNWTQLSALLQKFPADMFESVIHQHMPMFHMEHCVFAHTLSTGKDYRDCGRPCDRHQVDLKDRVGQAHPLIPDVGCRNTVFNASAQSAAEYVPRMKELGIRHFRVELLRESAEQATALLDRYARVLAGTYDGRETWRQLRVLNQLGVTRGTLDFA